MINYHKGDLFPYVDKLEFDGLIVIPHVCNDKKAWGSGFVVPLGKKYPRAKEFYLNQNIELGKAQLVPVAGFVQTDGVPYSQLGSRKVIVANMVAQTLGGKRPLYYNHLVKCMEQVQALTTRYAKSYPGKTAMIITPMFGSDRAGGNWDFISELIEDCWLKQAIPVTVCVLE